MGQVGRVHRHLELGVPGADGLLGVEPIEQAIGHGVTGPPELRLLAREGVGHAQQLEGRVGDIPPGAELDVDMAGGLEIYG